MITRNSKIGEVLKNPVGSDILGRLVQYAGLSRAWLENPLTKSVKLKMIPAVAGKNITMNLLDTMICLFNQCEGETEATADNTHVWWKEAVVYQIYPRSFKDGNADGIGDLPGIIEKLDYLQTLGVTAVWLSPVYDSPNDDNGYDIRDYRKIMDEFGCMEDMDALIEGLHSRGMRLIMDMVLNHTSDEHAWFRASKAEPDGQYGDFYIWKKSEGCPPNNWVSFFSGSAWKYYAERDAWALHLFSQKQCDLNWSNPDVRDELCRIVRFWCDKGVDGFRFDVINLIAKNSYEDGDETLGALLGMTGIEHYVFGERLHEYLRQLRKDGLREAFAVGETPGTGPRMNAMLTAKNREELNTAFCFDHLDCPGKNKYDDYAYDLNHLKHCLIEYEGEQAYFAWPSIFCENHDNPRMISKIDKTGRYRNELAKLIAALLLTARGTVFLYQGQEIGMVNTGFRDISELRDVESLNRYRELLEQGKTQAEAFSILLPGTRDHARTPMQWTGGLNAGFSSHTPWIGASEDAANCNVEAQEQDADSVLNAYRSLIRLRNADPTLIYGGFNVVAAHEKDLFCYVRTGADAEYIVEANLSERPRKSIIGIKDAERVFGNYPSYCGKLRPYEVHVYRKSKAGKM